MLRLRVCASVFLTLVACDTVPPPPQAPPKAAPRPARAPFRYQPTLDAHKPAQSSMELLAEAGDVARGRLLLVLAHHDARDLSVDVWTFESKGEDDTLIPKGAPVQLLPLIPESAVDAEVLDDFVRTRAAGHSPAARPQGVAGEDAPAVLEQLHAHASTALDTAAAPAARVAALAAFTRGLDDDLLFSRQGLPNALALMAKDATASLEQGSSRRASARWGDTKISMLRKGDGWTIDAVR